MARYTYATTINFGGDTPTAELEVEFSFTVVWGCPAQTYGPPEKCWPADPDEVDDIQVISVEGKRSGWSKHESDADFAETLINRLSERDRVAMLEEAAETCVGDHDAAMEARWEERRMGDL